MLEIIAWLGCVMLVLKGAEIYLSSMLEEYPELRRRIALIVLIVAVILAGVFAIMIVREAARIGPLQAAYEGTQRAVVKSFEDTARALEGASAPVDQPTAPADKGSAATDQVIEAVGQGGAGMDEDSGN